MVLAECNICCVATFSSINLPLRADEVTEAATAAISILQKHGIRSGLFGSLACHLYGVEYRDPKDVDLIVLNSDLDTEALQDLIIESSNGRFYSIRCRNPIETYRVLWYSLPSAAANARRRCKVDILQPGIMEVPEIPALHIFHTRWDDIPVVPLIFLILLKLNGWAKRRISAKQHWRAKVLTDVKDINALLQLALGRFRRDLSQEHNVPKAFWRLGEENARIYANQHPETAQKWAALGLDIEYRLQSTPSSPWYSSSISTGRLVF